MITLDELKANLHSVAIQDSVNGYELSIDSNGYITAKVNGNVTVEATDLDIRDLTSASDSVEIKTAAGQALSIDASGFITANINGDVNVTATDLDIRNLSASQDNVAISDGTNSLAVNADGSLNVQGAVSITKAGYQNWKVSAESVTTTESQLVSTPLTDRISILIQNLGNNDVYLSHVTGVSSSNGLKLAKGSSYTADLEDEAEIYAVAAAGTTNLRIVEYAAL